MYFGKQEKNILNKIVEGKIYDPYSYLLEIHKKDMKYIRFPGNGETNGKCFFLDHSVFNCNVSNEKGYEESKDISDDLKLDENHLIVFNNVEILYDYLVNFINLIQRLKEKDLIIFVSDTELVKSTFFTGINKGNRIYRDKRILGLFTIQEHREGIIYLESLRISPTHELKELVQTDNYLTKIELNNKTTNNNAKISTRVAFLAALSSIILSIVFNIISIKSSKESQILENEIGILKNQVDINSEIVDQFKIINNSLNNMSGIITNQAGLTQTEIKNIELSPIIEFKPNIEVLVSQDKKD